MRMFSFISVFYPETGLQYMEISAVYTRRYAILGHRVHERPVSMQSLSYLFPSCFPFNIQGRQNTKASVR